MKKIYLEDLAGLAEEQVYQLLNIYDRGFLGIVIPKVHDLRHDGVRGIYQDCLVSLYLAVRLFAISQLIGFSMPALRKRGEITVITSTREFRVLAGILCCMTSGYDERGMPRPTFLEALPGLIAEARSLYPSRATALDPVCAALERDLSEEKLQILEKQLAEGIL
ncbi:hypothetical protein [Flavisolibacter ginsengisoli]|jgi:hypothetical protein|uniref:Uncharacterized protein n=1 Tax=Flavisolibacter ginsengisoli DSM 18119 TaxID=1121884 RepID=A0A1M5GP58_9BACT|nr:hypothetical protein [Flavisolibacter ginsengisoli]SHG05341.1 hypothetical protein SAMN02745131_04192 [Flavisolibacter ginsengisoli DSM 18119]